MPMAIVPEARRKVRWLPVYHQCDTLPYPDLPSGTTFDCGCRRVWVLVHGEWVPAGPVQTAAHYVALARSARALERARAAKERIEEVVSRSRGVPKDDRPGQYL